MYSNTGKRKILPLQEQLKFASDALKKLMMF